MRRKKIPRRGTGGAKVLRLAVHGAAGRLGRWEQGERGGRGRAEQVALAALVKASVFILKETGSSKESGKGGSIMRLTDVEGGCAHRVEAKMWWRWSGGNLRRGPCSYPGERG